MSFVYTGNIRRMDDLHRIVIPEYICMALNYEAGTPFEFYADTHERAVILRPYGPDTKGLCYENKHNVEVWLESQIETFSMFGYNLNFFLPNGQTAIPNSSAPIPTGEDMETAFNFWKKWNTSYCYKEDKGGHWWLYPIVDKERPILWIAYPEPPYSNEYPIYSLADAYLEKFVR